MNRRIFLRSAAGLALAAPFLPSMWRRMARGAAAPLPRRTVIFFSPTGCLTTRWFPNVEDGPLDAAALQGTTLEPLTPYVSKLLFPRGLRSMNPYGKAQSIDPHIQAMGSKFTCALLDSQRVATSPSLDHVMARQINPAGAPPLVLGVGTGKSPFDLLSFSAPGIAYVPNVNPRSVYDGLGSLLSAQPGQLEYLRQRKLSVLDAVSDDLQTYRRLDLSASDKARVEAWQDLLRDTERDLAALSCTPGAVGIDPAAVDAASVTGNATAYTIGADMMFKLMALNMLCDANRVFLMSFSSFVVFDWDGIHHTHDHDGISHRTGDFSVGGTCLPNCLVMLAQIDSWYANKFLKLVSLFDGLPEGDGTLLDNTATTWMMELSDGGAFNLNNLAICVAGSAGGYFKQGQSINVEGAPIGRGHSEDACYPGGDQQLSGKYTGSTGGNVPINKFYVNLMNAMGCTAPGGGPVTTFGVLDGMTSELGITNPGELTALKA